MFIQDSYRYQKYSYLITVDEKLEAYKSLIKSYLHPAGTALFGEYQIQNNFMAGVSATQELNKKIKKYKKIIKKREIKLKEIQEKIDLLLATK
jgi:hypothetical protein